MEEILHQLIGSLSQYLRFYFTSQVVSRISEPSTVAPFFQRYKKKHAIPKGK